MLPPSGFDLNTHLDQIRSDTKLTGLLLLIPILNSLLLMRLATFYLSILAMAKYLTHIVSPRLSALLGSPVLGWDKTSIEAAKGPWLAVRSLSQSLFAVLSEGISVFILVHCLYALGTNRFLGLLYIGSWISVFLSILSVAAVLYAGANFHKNPSLHLQVSSARTKNYVLGGNMRNKLPLLLEKASFYLGNIIIVFFIFNAWKGKSIEDLMTLGVILLGIIGALSGLCYSGASSRNNQAASKSLTVSGRRFFTESEVYRVSGDRFLHSFLALTFAFIFLGALIHIQKYGVFGLHNKVLITFAAIPLIGFGVIGLSKAARSFSMGFHMIYQILNQNFPLKDQALFEDLDRDSPNDQQDENTKNGSSKEPANKP